MSENMDKIRIAAYKLMAAVKNEKVVRECCLGISTRSKMREWDNAEKLTEARMEELRKALKEVWK